MSNIEDIYDVLWLDSQDSERSDTLDRLPRLGRQGRNMQSLFFILHTRYAGNPSKLQLSHLYRKIIRRIR